MIPAVEHIKQAEKLLAEAHHLVNGTRCHLAKTYAAMSQAHTALAQLAHDMARDTPPRVITGVNVATHDPALNPDTLWLLPSATEPRWERTWPGNVVMATKVYHPGTQTDISRDEHAYFLVEGETREHYIGQWVEGFGLVMAWAEKSGTRPLTSDERARLDNSEVVIV